MSKSDQGEDGTASPRLPRLPPGRHGLSREFVTKNQQDRIAAGVIASVAEKGYHQMTISDISEAAGVSRRTFYAYFKSKEEAYFATYELIIDHLRAASRAVAADKEDWGEKVRARIAGTLEFFAANPDLARFIVIAPQRAGGKLIERYQLALEEASAELIEGKPAKVKTPSAVVQQSMISGMMSLIAREVEAGKGEKLPKLLPDLVELFLGPLLGHEKAAKIAKSSSKRR